MKKKNLNWKDLAVAIVALLISLSFVFSAYITGKRNATLSKASLKSKKIKIENGFEFLNEMEEKNIKGGSLLLLDESLHTDIPTFTPTLDPQENIKNLREIYNPKKITPNEENFIYLAIIENRIKNIYLVVPSKKWEKVKKELLLPFLKPTKNSLVGTFYDGTPITISPSNSPVLPKRASIILLNESSFPQGEKYIKTWTEKGKLHFDLIFLLQKEEGI
jgi:hypothetical protein